MRELAQKDANATEAAFLSVNVEERPGFKPHFLFLMKNAD